VKRKKKPLETEADDATNSIERGRSEKREKFYLI
jgi:hypothetical protein